MADDGDGEFVLNIAGHEELEDNNDEEPEVAQGLKVAQEEMAFGLSTPLSCARMGWFKSAKCCGVGKSSPTCGRSALNPNQLHSEWGPQSAVLDAA